MHSGRVTEVWPGLRVPHRKYWRGLANNESMRDMRPAQIQKQREFLLRSRD